MSHDVKPVQEEKEAEKKSESNWSEGLISNVKFIVYFLGLFLIAISIHSLCINKGSLEYLKELDYLRISVLFVGLIIIVYPFRNLKLLKNIFITNNNELDQITLKRIIAWGSIVILFVLLLCVYYLFQSQEVSLKDLCTASTPSNIQFHKVLILVLMITAIFGAIGGIAYNLRKVTEYSLNFDTHLAITYLLNPFLGSICGILSGFLLVLGQIVVITTTTTNTNPVNALEQLKPLIILMSVSLLAGFASQDFMKKVDELIQIIFSTKKIDEKNIQKAIELEKTARKSLLENIKNIIADEKTFTKYQTNFNQADIKTLSEIVEKTHDKKKEEISSILDTQFPEKQG